MRNQQLLEQAQKKFANRNNLTQRDYNLSIDDFILRAYDCDPATYGKALQNRILNELTPLCYQMSNNSDQGDFYLSCLPTNYNGFLYYYEWDSRIKLLSSYNWNENYRKYERKIVKFGEIKTSYLSPSSLTYNIKNLRPWQDIDMYIICFVDCINNFTPEYYVVNPKTLYDNFTLTATNGMKKNNEGNKFTHKSINFKKNSEAHDKLKLFNMASGTTFNDIMDYLNEEKYDMKEIFFNNVAKNLLNYNPDLPERYFELFKTINNIMEHKKWGNVFDSDEDKKNIEDDYFKRRDALIGYVFLKDYNDVKEGTIISNNSFYYYSINQIYSVKDELMSNNTEYIKKVFFIVNDDGSAEIVK